MDLLITDTRSLRALSRMVHCASKIGEHVQLSWQTPSTLSLRAINPSHSTFVHFRCFPTFFSSSTPPLPSLSFKLPCRALLPLFRLSHTLVSLRLTAASPSAPSLVFALRTRAALLKTFRLPVSDGRIAVTAFDKRLVSCLLSARPPLFLDALAHFHARLDELTLAPSPTALRLASFVDDVANPANVILRTELTLPASEFLSYVFPKSAELPLTIFCKYLRAALDFCDAFDAPIRMWYEKSGHPVLFDQSITGSAAEALFDVQFIFASRHAEDPDDDDDNKDSNANHPTASAHPAARRSNQHVQLQQILQTGPTQITQPFSSARTPAQAHLQHPPMDPMEDIPHVSARSRGRASMGHTHAPDSAETQAPSTQDFDPPSSKRNPRSVFDDHPQVDHEDDDDDDFVEGTPPP